MFRVTADLMFPTRLQCTLRCLFKVLLSLKVRDLHVVGKVQTAFHSLHNIQVVA